MSDQIVLEKNDPAGAIAKTEDESAACPMRGKGWFTKGALGMAICCAAPMLLIAAISFFGLSLGAITSGALSLVALLACPVGMFWMIRLMMRERQEDQTKK